MSFPGLILASSSPRRQEILSLTLLPFETVSIDTPERFDINLSIEENVKRIALEKAEAAFAALPNEKKKMIILAADTIVVKDGQILGKPGGYREAIGMLESLQDSSHQVFTGFALLSGKKMHQECVSTTVEIEAMSSDEISHYLDTMKPFDKAGAYGIQDPLMACHIRCISGCYYNVVGLPLARVCKALKSFLP
jgi:septum formation protein